jgi:hypothetical protein
MSWKQIEELLDRRSIDAVYRAGEVIWQQVGSGGGPVDEGVVHVLTPPRITHHRLAALAGNIRRTAASRKARWLLGYPASSLAGVQVILSALVGGGTLVEPYGRSSRYVCEALQAHEITHMSGTPKLWRKVQLALKPGERLPHLQHLTLGESGAHEF